MGLVLGRERERGGEGRLKKRSVEVKMERGKCDLKYNKMK